MIWSKVAVTHKHVLINKTYAQHVIFLYFKITLCTVSLDRCWWAGCGEETDVPVGEGAPSQFQAAPSAGAPEPDAVPAHRPATTCLTQEQPTPDSRRAVTRKQLRRITGKYCPEEIQHNKYVAR